MRIVARTDLGFKRRENEDRYVRGLLANGVGFAFVRDGMGGANGGSVASSKLCKTIEECMFIENDNTSMDREKTVLSAVDTACSDIYYQGQRDEKLSGMGTTLTGVTIKDDECLVYNIGDSRVYIYRAGALVQITEDHSLVQQLYKQGAITREEMAVSPQKHLITRAVGVRPQVETDISEIKLKAGDRLLCASDGLIDFVSKDDIAGIMADVDFYGIADNLIKKALSNNASDNITAVVVEY